MHYLDNSATTRVLEPVARKAFDMMTESFANPSSVYKLGVSAKNELDTARKNVAKLMSVASDRVFFTSGGTEAINTAVFGASHKGRHGGKHIITSSAEHSAVLECMKKLESEGFEVTYLSPTAEGNISVESFRDAVHEDTIFASIMLVNNETGAINDIGTMCDILKEKRQKAMFHVDAVQGFAKLSLANFSDKVDFISISGHKIGAPKGVGALYVKKGITVKPYMLGGGQEGGFRSGTENMPSIMALSTACEIRHEKLGENYSHVTMLNSYLREKIAENFPFAVFNGQNTLPYVCNFSLEGCKSEVMLRILQDSEVYVSAGSACSKNKKSYVLLAMGIKASLIDSALRISFCPESTTEDIDALINALHNGVKMLRR